MTVTVQLDEAGRRLSLVRSIAVDGIAVAEYVCDPGFVLGEHVHRGACLNFILAGGQHEDSAHGPRHLGCGTTTFAAEPTPHRIAANADGNRVLHVELDAARFEGWDAPRRGGPAIACDRVGAAAAAMARVRSELHAADPVTPLALGEAVSEAVAVFGRDDAMASGRAPGWLARVDAELRERLAQPPALGELARRIGVHPVHLSRAFRRRFGETLTARLRRARVERACLLLATRGAELAEVALELGFVDQAHFTRAFRRVTRLTPGRYRAMVRGAD